MIYLDNSSTTAVDPEVIETMINVMKNFYGNPSSLHDFGVQAENVMEKSREVIADQLRCLSQEIIFTSGGTEANNLAIQGVAYQYQRRGKHLITSEVEHESVYNVYQKLEKQGWEVTYLPVDFLGRVRLEDVEKAITKQTVLVSIIHVNNEVGTIQPISDIGRILKAHPRVFFHVDAVQSFGRVALIPGQANIDLLSISAHKFHGPKGIGCLFKAKSMSLDSLFLGGGQEYGFRSGTQNIPAIAGMAKAILSAEKKRIDFLKQCATWKSIIINRLTKSIRDIKVNGDVSEEGGVPYIVSLSFPSLKSEVLVHALEDQSILVGTKSACSSKRDSPSRVLLAMGVDTRTALGTIRISMGFETDEMEIKRTIEVLERIIPEYQQIVKVSNK